MPKNTNKARKTDTNFDLTNFLNSSNLISKGIDRTPPNI